MAEENGEEKEEEEEEGKEEEEVYNYSWHALQPVLTLLRRKDMLVSNKALLMAFGEPTKSGRRRRFWVYFIMNRFSIAIFFLLLSFSPHTF